MKSIVIMLYGNPKCGFFQLFWALLGTFYHGYHGYGPNFGGYVKFRISGNMIICYSTAVYSE